MLIAMLDKPLSEAQALVDNPDAFVLEISKIIQNKHAHLVIAQMLHLMCVTTCLLQNGPLSHQKPKQSHGNDESRAASNAISVSPTYALPSTWDIHGWPNIPMPNLHVPTVQHGILMAGLHALTYIASSVIS